MPRLIRGVARTAVIAGTATAVSGRVRRRQAEKSAEGDAADEQQTTQQAPPAPAASGQDDMVAQLKQLAELKDQGILTEEEFTAQKAKILNS
ncbi:MAG: SHOCT domain-containing protein [Actinobacteria bacterium]|nr:SHOCT domain-containing protein [Actinomycetota bacterium]